MGVNIVEEKSLNGLEVGFEDAFHTHHPLLKENDDLQRRFPSEEHLVGRTPPPVDLGGRPVETTGRPDGGGKPQAVAIGVLLGDGAQVDEWVGEMVARGMATVKRAPDSAVHDPVLFGHVRSGVFPTNVDSIAELGELPTNELAAAVHAKTSRSPHAVHVGQETPDILGGV